MKFWVTKDALTKGIFEVEAEVCHDIENKPMDMIKVVESQSKPGQYFHKEGRDFHRTQLDAINCALAMGHKKISNLKKKIDSLEWQQSQLRNQREQLFAKLGKK